MLLYIIDGYNLIHKVRTLKNSSQPQKDLIRYIEKNRLKGSKNNKLTIVFDGNLDQTLRQPSKDFRVIGSGSKTADDVIKKLVTETKNKSQIVVVSDDRALRYAVRQEGAKLSYVADFIKTKPKKSSHDDKEISYSLEHEITEELRKIWLKEQ